MSSFGATRSWWYMPEVTMDEDDASSAYDVEFHFLFRLYALSYSARCHVGFLWAAE